MKTTIAVFSKDRMSHYIARLFGDAEIIDIKDFPQIPEDTERLGIITSSYNGNLPYEVEDYIKNEIGVRDNSNLKYIFGIATYGTNALWIDSQFSRALSDAGCVLSYVEKLALSDSFEPLQKEGLSEEEAKKILLEAQPKLERIMKDVENEEFKLAKYSLLYRIFRKFGRNKPENR